MKEHVMTIAVTAAAVALGVYVAKVAFAQTGKHFPALVGK